MTSRDFRLKSVYLLLVIDILLSYFIHSAPIYFGSYNGANSCSDPVSCYLNNIVFPLPDISFEFEGSTFTLTNTLCKGVELTSIPSSYDLATSLNVGLCGLGTHCDGNYQYGKFMKGTMTIGIDQTNATMNVYTEKKDEFPVHMSLSDCKIDSINVDIGFSSPGLDSLAPILSSMIEKVIDNILCTGVNHLLEYNVSNFLVNTVDPNLQTIILSHPEPYPKYNKHYLNWNDSLISTIHNAVLKIQGLTNLPEFLKCMANEDKTTPAPPAYVQLFQELLYGKHSIDVRKWENNRIFASDKFSLEILDVAVSGLDSLSNVQILEPLPESKVTLRTGLTLDSLRFDMHFLLTLQGVDSNGNATIYTEKILFSLGVRDALFLLDTVVAVDEHLLDSYYLDQLSSIGCWLSPLTEVSIPNLKLDVSTATMEILQIEGDAGLLEADIIDFFDNIFLLFLSEDGFGTLTMDTLQGLFQGPIRVAINERIANELALSKKSQPCLAHYPYDDSVDYLKWPESNAVSKLNSIINEFLGYEGINQFFSCATSGTGAFEIYLKRAKIILSGLNSFYGLSLITPNPDQLYRLSTSFAVGYCPSEENCNPLMFGLEAISKDLIGEWFGSSAGITKAMDAVLEGAGIYLTFENFQLSLETLSKLNLNSLRQLHHSQMGVKGCYAQSMDHLSFEMVELNATKSIMIYKDISTSMEIAYGIDPILRVLTNNDSVTSKNLEIDTRLHNAEAVCQAGGVVLNDDDLVNEDTEEKLSKTLQILILIGAVVFLVLGSYYSWRYFKYAKEAANDPRTFWERWEMDTAIVFHSDIPLWVRIVLPCATMASFALYVDSDAGYAVDVLMKIHISEQIIDLGTVFQFGLPGTVQDMWDANVYFLAVVVAFFSGGWPFIKLTMMMAGLFAPYSLVSVDNRETLLIVLDALGKWSLIDFFVMVLFSNAFYIQMWVGDQILVDVICVPRWGFYSFVFATMMSLVSSHILLGCHRYIVEPKELPFTDHYDPKESLSSIVYEMNVSRMEEILLIPRKLSDLTSSEAESSRNNNNISNNKSHPFLLPSANSSPMKGTIEKDLEKVADNRMTGEKLFSDNHEKKKQAAESSLIKDQAIEEQVLEKEQEAFLLEVPEENEDQSILYVRFTWFGKILITFIVCVTFFFIIAGTFIQTMGFEFKGLVGFFLGLQGSERIDYSFVEIGLDVPSHSGMPNDPGVRWMQVSFFLFGLVMPLALMTFILALWLIPLTLTYQRIIYVVAQCLNAWSALDVFCLAIAASLLEIQQFAAFVFRDYCGKINEILKEYFDDAMDGDDKCIDVVAYLKYQSWFVFVAAALILLVGTIVLRVCNFAIKQRLANAKTELLNAELLRQHIEEAKKKEAAEVEKQILLRDHQREQRHSSNGLIIGEKSLVDPLLEAANSLSTPAPPFHYPISGQHPQEDYLKMHEYYKVTPDSVYTRQHPPPQPGDPPGMILQQQSQEDGASFQTIVIGSESSSQKHHIPGHAHHHGKKKRRDSRAGVSKGSGNGSGDPFDVRTNSSASQSMADSSSSAPFPLNYIFFCFRAISAPFWCCLSWRKFQLGVLKCCEALYILKLSPVKEDIYPRDGEISSSDHSSSNQTTSRRLRSKLNASESIHFSSQRSLNFSPSKSYDPHNSPYLYYPPGEEGSSAGGSRGEEGSGEFVYETLVHESSSENDGETSRLLQKDLPQEVPTELL